MHCQYDVVRVVQDSDNNILSSTMMSKLPTPTPQRSVMFQSSTTVVEIQSMHDIIYVEDNNGNEEGYGKEEDSSNNDDNNNNGERKMEQAKSLLYYSKKDFSDFFTEASYDLTWKKNYDQRRISSQHHCQSILMQLQEEKEEEETKTTPKKVVEVEHPVKPTTTTTTSSAVSSSGRPRRANVRERRGDREATEEQSRQRSLPTQTEIEEEVVNEEEIGTKTPGRQRAPRGRRPVRGNGQPKSLSPMRAKGRVMVPLSSTAPPIF